MNTSKPTLSFDCYGTLIDWELGILTALLPWFASKSITPDSEEVLSLYARFEPEAEHGPFKPYRQVLHEVMAAYAHHYHLTLAETEKGLLARSVPTWPPFPDTVPALRRLAQHYNLIILSNIDEDMIQGTAKLLEVDFHRIITAQQVGAYKPSPRNFQALLAFLGGDITHHIHVAQSLYHDIAPASALGIPTIWVNRRQGKPGEGASPFSTATPDFEVPSLKALADHLLPSQ